MRDKLRSHIGHHLQCVRYGNDNENDICIECLTCNEVLVSAETFEFEEENK